MCSVLLSGVFDCVGTLFKHSPVLPIKLTVLTVYTCTCTQLQPPVVAGVAGCQLGDIEAGAWALEKKRKEKKAPEDNGALWQQTEKKDRPWQVMLMVSWKGKM